MSEGSEIKERVDRMSYQDLHVKAMKLTDFVAFRTFCFENTGGNYAAGIKLLMESATQSEKEEFIFSKLSEIENRLTELEEGEIVEKPKIKTLGSGGKK